MAVTNTEYFTKVGEPGNATTLAAPGHSIGGTSITVDSTSLFPTGTSVIFAIDTTTLVNGVETRVDGSYTVWQGIVTGATTIGSMVKRYGTDQNYSAGATTRVYVLPTSSRENRLVDGLLVSLDQDGTLKADAVDVSAVLADDVVTTAKIDDGAVTNAKMDWSTFSNNIKSTTNTSIISLGTDNDQDLASSGLSLSFTSSGTSYAFVSVSIGAGFPSDAEFRPEIRLGGTIVRTLAPSAVVATSTARATVRGFSYLVTLVNGVNTISAGIFASVDNGTIAANGATISAIVLGNITA